jgi:hypothetical protein
MTESTLTIDEIMDVFSVYDGVYPRAAIDAAIQQREAVIPHLMEVINEIVNDRAKPEHNEAVIYAAMLLGHFRATEAHDLIVQLFSLPDEIVDALFGDIITEDLSMILLRTCGGSVERIKELVLNRDAEAFCRGAAAEALTYAVAEGFYPREEALAFLSSLFTGNEADEQDSPFWGLVAVAIRNLYPAEVMPVMRQAFENDLIPTFLASVKDFEEVVADSSVEQQVEELRTMMARRSLDDIHASMSSWAAFQPADEAPVARPALLSHPAPVRLQMNTQSADKAKKKKRKMVKASRKKNRRK